MFSPLNSQLNHQGVWVCVIRFRKHNIKAKRQMKIKYIKKKTKIKGQKQNQN